MILINRSFAEITPESAEDGENSDSGMLAKNEECTFRELIKLFQEHCVPSDSHISGFTWFSTGFYTKDYRTGTEREESIHFSKDNPERMRKYWFKAAKAAHGGDWLTK